MFATVVSVVVTAFIAIGVANDVVVPAGAYAIEKGTEVYDAGKELYLEKVTGSDI